MHQGRLRRMSHPGLGTLNSSWPQQVGRGLAGSSYKHAGCSRWVCRQEACQAGRAWEQREVQQPRAAQHSVFYVRTPQRVAHLVHICWSCMQTGKKFQLLLCNVILPALMLLNLSLCHTGRQLLVASPPPPNSSGQGRAYALGPMG